jgi:TetR/AcrR family transcriptional regulator, cholesterol catabolism regulator
VIRTQLGTILDDAHDFVPVLHYEWRSLTPARRRVVALKDRYDALWQGLIDELQQAGHMPGDAQLIRLLILGAVNWTGAWYMSGGRLSLDDVAEGAAALFLRSMPQ